MGYRVLLAGGNLFDGQAGGVTPNWGPRKQRVLCALRGKFRDSTQKATMADNLPYPTTKASIRQQTDAHIGRLYINFK